MHSAADRRAKQRVVVGPDVTLKFKVKQYAFQNIRITNLSVGGCFATLPRTSNQLFKQGTLLEDFQFEHPDLAGDPLLAKVAYVLGGGTGGGRGGLELIGLGIHFVSMTPAMGTILDDFVAARC